MEPARKITIQQDYVTLSDLFNVNFKVVKNHFGLFWAKKFDFTDQQIEEIFSKSMPYGLDREICSILDKGYKIEVIATGPSIKTLKISKKTGNDLEPVYTNSNRIFSAFTLTIELFYRTLGADIPVPFKYDDWFPNGKYPKWGCDSSPYNTILDLAFDQHLIGLTLDKTAENLYKIAFATAQKGQVEILCKNITDY